jgi:hypothetical protein
MPSKQHKARETLLKLTPVSNEPPAAESDSARLLRYRELLQKCEVDGWDHFDDLLFKVAAGARALSVTLLGVLGNRVAPTSMKWSFFAWGALGASLFVLLLSVLASQAGNRKAIAAIDAGTFYKTKRPQGVIGALTLPLNVLAAFLCFVGILSLLRFAGLNVTDEQKGNTAVSMKPTETTALPAPTDQAGRPLPAPPVPHNMNPVPNTPSQPLNQRPAGAPNK